GDARVPEGQRALRDDRDHDEAPGRIGATLDSVARVVGVAVGPAEIDLVARPGHRRQQVGRDEVAARVSRGLEDLRALADAEAFVPTAPERQPRSEEHTSEL